ncbi:Holliday junction branch migration protein RuvA [Neomegalonema perideroedes]|uniref:Holliday junction branch migration protein RuvA n=1 Tax=Neomegalonema perideroedes TaxID=217219 RepID=UPI0003745A41|nr:Holliday junction branch migration protein RuvA [Neomegalonema perideroedes]
MIGRLTGVVGYLAEDHALIDVGGVGYLVHCSNRTLSALPAAGGRVSLYTELEVREDGWKLMGFPSLLEREWHKLLTSVQGVGAKVSLGILGALGPEGVAHAIALQDPAPLRRAPGVGPKLAQRLLLDLKGKSPGVVSLGAPVEAESPEPVTDAAPPEAAARKKSAKSAKPDEEAEARRRAETEALSALSNLGYAPAEAAAAIRKASAEGVAGTSDLIRAALKALAPQN